MVAYTPALAAHLCARVRRGESLRTLCADPDMPARRNVQIWRHRYPTFALRLERARQLGGFGGRGRPSSYDPARAERLLERIVAGEALQNICREPGLPDISTVYYWRRLHPEFARALAIARRMQRELIVEEGWEIAEAATRETARAVARRLKHLRWRVAMLYPTKYDSDADLVIPDPEPLRLRRDRSSPPAQRRGRG